MKKKYILVPLTLLFTLCTYAQIQRPITLPEAIALARIQSVDAAVALNELKTSYWEYRTFRADLLPEMNFTGTLPNYKKSYNSYQNEDGSYSYVRTNTLGLTGELSIDQNIWLTGGKLSLTSSLDFIRQLGANKYNQFMSVPVGLRLDQPVFGVNHIKWNRRIEPVRYAEAKASFISATEEVTIKSINYFFQLLLAREELATSQQNRENADRLYEIAVARRKMGQISENEVLQLELAALNAKSNLTESERKFNMYMFQLRSFLGLSESEMLEPVVPESAPDLTLEYGDILNKALERNAFAQNIRRRQLQADYEVAQAKGNLRSINLFANFGYTGQDKTIASSYRNLRDNQVVEVGVTIPILDWGKRRGKVKVAESNRDVVMSRIRQEEMNFNQDIYLLVDKFNTQAAQLEIAGQADEIAQKRYKTSIETFLIGMINTLDLNDAQNSKDNARQSHIYQMYYYWLYYYQIRSVTLWDYERNTELEVDFEDVIRN